ncbi:unnamed protein product [[Candida] boidinii]|uniref:Unnamed protein product n=1 Tax=Candida boidinii TaxID=5477 RepID=A0A9W6SYV1_CANBO|nr:hypothetical protein BVG19_g5282 [[Candida] boidinii]OWB53802.1 hypothetical protein B5S27_g5411 [[Candida] boidinii]OWB69357.1 hypothetical protein B5S30_g4764 [[Candida] boidinii]OWB86634.1 hypothetical protein B5S33_g5341 [[Candida] boidinii]GME68976.1 unnamed protein product [[Candida] boidinii]
MSFKFPDLSSLQQTLSKTSEQLQQTFQEGLKEASQLNDNLSPIFKRTQRSLQEKFGQIDDVSELPKEYIELEKKIDSLKNFYKKILIITEQYEIESYDYPPNLRESFSDYTKIINEKFHGLAAATSTSELENVLTTPSESAASNIPKTFHHTLSKVLKSNREVLLNSQNDEDNSLTKALLKISEIEFKIGDERLEQDKLIITEFNNKIKKILNEEFVKTNNFRKQVEISRLNFDTIRAEIKAIQKGDETVEIPDKLSKNLENSEDELVHATELAVESMKKLINPLESVNLLKVFTKIQLNYYKSVTDELTTLVDQLDALPIDEDDEDDK